MGFGALAGLTACAAVSPGATPLADAGANDDANDEAPLFPPEVRDGSPPVACPVACPPTQPEAGAACGPLQRSCSYGIDGRTWCRDRLDCVAGVWKAATKPANCADPPSTACPLVIPHRSSACTASAECFYPEGECRCDGVKNSTWYCAFDTGVCPPSAPNLGQRCAGERTMCAYPTILCAPFICRCGIWTAEPYPCE